MGSGDRFEPGALLAWRLDVEGSYRDTGRPEWQFVALDTLPGGKPRLGRLAAVSVADVTSEKGLPEAQIEPRADGEVRVTSSEPLLVQHYGQDRPFAPGTTDTMPYGSVLRTGSLLLAPLYAEHAESVRQGRDTLPEVAADPGRIAGARSLDQDGSVSSGEAQDAPGRHTLELARKMYRPRGLVLLSVAELILVYLVGGMLLTTFVMLPARGVATTGRWRPIESQFGGIVYEFDLRGRTYMCGPSRVGRPSGEAPSITYDPSRPTSCRATVWISRLAADEVFFTGLFVGVTVAWAAVLINFIRHRRRRA